MKRTHQWRHYLFVEEIIFHAKFQSVISFDPFTGRESAYPYCHN